MDFPRKYSPENLFAGNALLNAIVEIALQLVLSQIFFTVIMHLILQLTAFPKLLLNFVALKTLFIVWCAKPCFYPHKGEPTNPASGHLGICFSPSSSSVL